MGLENYRSQIVTLSSHVNSKMINAIERANLDITQDTKLQRTKDRCEITARGVERIIKFFLHLTSNDESLGSHSNVISHLQFLHARFLLETCRIYLVAGGLSVASDSPRGHRKEPTLASSSTILDTTVDEDHDQNNTVPKTAGDPTFAERLASLTLERKERDKELVQLVSDIENTNLMTS